jgi:integrase
MGKPKPRSVAIERNIRRVLVKQRWAYRVQMGSRGRGHRRSKLCQTLEEALQIKKAWLAGGLPAASATDDPADAAPATVDDGLRHYVLALAQPRKNDRPGQAEARAGRAEQVRLALRAVHAEFANTAMSAVTVQDIEEFVRRRLAPGGSLKAPGASTAAGCANNTVVRDLRALRAMLKAVRPDFKVPAHVFPAENLTRVRQLTPTQQVTIYDDMALRSGPLFARLAKLCLLGVLRQQDARYLERSMVRLAERVLLLPQTKSGQPRNVRLSQEAVELLAAQLAEIPPTQVYVFADPKTGKPYSRYHIWRVWHASAQACGLQDFTFHDQRHHGPTLAVNHGANTATLKALLGVKSDRMVDRYAHVMSPTVEAYLEQISRHGAAPTGPS